MAKRPDHGQDATQELSASQVLRDLPPARPPRPKVPVNDVSMWGRKVVGTEEFAPALAPPAARSRRWVIVGALGALAVAGAGYGIWRVMDDGGDAAAAKVAPAEKTVEEKPAKGDPAKAGAAKSDPAKGDPAKAGTAKSDLAKSDPAKGDLAKTEPAKTDPATTDSAKTELATPPDTKPDAISSVAPVIKPAIKRAPARTATAVKRPVAKKPVLRKPPPKRR